MDQSKRNSGWLGRLAYSIRLASASAVTAGTILIAAPVGEAGAAPGDKALTLYNTHTQQKATVVFKRGNRYDPAGLKQLSYMLRDWRRNEPTKMDPRLFDLVWEVYRQSGAREPIHIVSGYRSPTTNNMLRSRSRGVAKHSQHTLGKAMDFFIPGVALPKLREIGLRMQVGGVGFYPTSGSPFVHMDTGGVRHWPKMTRQQLVRIFPDGKTLHIPSDGKPLPGYQQALAAYKARRAGGGEIMMASAEGSAPKKGWLSRLFSGGADEQDDNADAEAIAVAKAPAARTPAPARAQPAEEDAPAIAATPTPKPQAEPELAEPAPAPETVVAMAPVPRPSPVARVVAEDPAPDTSDATVQVAEADLPSPPVPRHSPVVRPAVALASASADVPLPIPAGGVSGQAAAVELAALERPVAVPVANASRARTAADAIADAIGSKDQPSSAMMAYAPSSDVPHIDADTGALVAGLSAGRSRNGAKPALGSGSDWRDPLARLSPVGYGADTIELVMRSGSTRQKAYAVMAMPHPFAMPELFTAPEGAIELGFGRVAYEGLRTDRFSGPLVSRLGTMQFASNEDLRRTASLKR